MGNHDPYFGVSDFFLRSASHLFGLSRSATPHIMAEEQVTARLDRAGTLQASIYANVVHEKITIVSAGCPPYLPQRKAHFEMST